MLEGSKIERVAESAFMVVLARLVLPPIVVLAMAIASWYLSKQSDQLERLNNSLIDATQNSKLLQQRVELQVRTRDGQLTDVYGRINDHESRLRGLERPRVQ